MSLSRSPSPVPGGGWASPGLNITGSGRNSPSRGFTSGNSGSSPVIWEGARLKNGASNSGAASGGFRTNTGNQRGIMGHVRRLSSGLPLWNNGRAATPYAEKEKLGRGRWHADNLPLVSRVRRAYSRTSRRTRIVLWALGLILLATLIFYNTPLVYHYRRAPALGGGQKFVVILAANVGGGVMEWKGAREWAIERDSTRNKKKYAATWGYDLEIVDMSTKKRYAHEWRESWEKVDFVRTCMRKYPKAEWFWWLDLNTFVMEPSYSLQSHIFNDIQKHVYRDINAYNPLNISHPPTDTYLDVESRSSDGDGNPNSVNLILSQDCSGFNLGSFFLRRSAWTDRLLDVWWDPVAYEQKHMEWAHKEQDALEQMYVALPWVRKHTGFLPQRMINSFPPGACNEHGNDSRIHYDEKDRDFLVNMAGCEWGRDCWGEMYNYRELSYYLNRTWWERFKEDFLALIWFKLTGQKVKF
ncbi:galactosyltransferase [Gaeumannomyces tritici R3-111a-1]|uniref:Galactosyltransferase n=1 Tax=Gaeumannomyces tritici (strain R3-111a-1) TaxID=644352 RepID=J3P9L1_GAET3|nr:galactosyltransferase [Gaeumannomyces tritici R3-111a-1]EJT73347.1 galactosyltransferase [Gaeumannomyces tritici R3-111a-1]